MVLKKIFEKLTKKQGVPEPKARLECIKKVLKFLPKGNARLLKALCRFLYKVQEKSAINKMDSQNLAIVFAPNLLRTREQDIRIMLGDTPHASGLMNTLILEYKYLFEDIDDEDSSQNKVNNLKSSKEEPNTKGSSNLLSNIPKPPPKKNIQNSKPNNEHLKPTTPEKPKVKPLVPPKRHTLPVMPLPLRKPSTPPKKVKQNSSLKKQPPQKVMPVLPPPPPPPRKKRVDTKIVNQSTSGSNINSRIPQNQLSTPQIKDPQNGKDNIVPKKPLPPVPSKPSTPRTINKQPDKKLDTMKPVQAKKIPPPLPQRTNRKSKIQKKSVNIPPSANLVQ